MKLKSLALAALASAVLVGCGGGSDTDGSASVARRTMTDADVRNYTTAAVLQSSVTDLYAQQVVGFAGALMLGLSTETSIPTASSSCDNFGGTLSVAASKGFYTGWRSGDQLTANMSNCRSDAFLVSGEITVRAGNSISALSPFATSLSVGGLSMTLRDFSLTSNNTILPTNGTLESASLFLSGNTATVGYRIPASGWSIRSGALVFEARGVTQSFLSDEIGTTRRFNTNGTYAAGGVTLNARVVETARVPANSAAPTAGAWEITSISSAPSGARILATMQNNGLQVLLQADTDGNGTLDASQLVSAASLFQ
jgi:hypothetical protein